ncbi:hypothetical protein ACCS33_38035, partial [Rhizobium ruizarguesonis]
MTIDELVTRTAKHVDTLDASTTDEIVARVVSTPPSRRHTSPRTITLNLPIPPQGAMSLQSGLWQLLHNAGITSLRDGVPAFQGFDMFACPAHKSTALWSKCHMVPLACDGGSLDMAHNERRRRYHCIFSGAKIPATNSEGECQP